MSDPTPFGPLSPILPAPVSLGDEAADEAAMRRRRHEASHYTFASIDPNATNEQLAALAEWCRARFEAAVAACPECELSDYEVTPNA